MASDVQLIPPLAEIRERFPDEAACSTFLKSGRWGDNASCLRCGKPAAYYMLTKRCAWSCEYCRHQIYPTAGTILHGTKVPLPLWFELLAELDQDSGVIAQPTRVLRVLGRSRVSINTAVRIRHVLLARHEREADWLAELGGSAPAGFAPERLVIDNILAHAPSHLQHWPFGKSRRIAES